MEKDNAAMVEERDGHIKQLQERIAWLNRGIEVFGKAILEVLGCGGPWSHRVGLFDCFFLALGTRCRVIYAIY